MNAVAMIQNIDVIFKDNNFDKDEFIIRVLGLVCTFSDDEIEELLKSNELTHFLDSRLNTGYMQRAEREWSISGKLEQIVTNKKVLNYYYSFIKNTLKNTYLKSKDSHYSFESHLRGSIDRMLIGRYHNMFRVNLVPVTYKAVPNCNYFEILKSYTIQYKSRLTSLTGSDGSKNSNTAISELTELFVTVIDFVEGSIELWGMEVADNICFDLLLDIVCTSIFVNKILLKDDVIKHVNYYIKKETRILISDNLVQCWNTMPMSKLRRILKTLVSSKDIRETFNLEGSVSEHGDKRLKKEMFDVLMTIDVEL